MRCSRRRSPRGCSRSCASPHRRGPGRRPRSRGRRALRASPTYFACPAFSPAVAIPAVLVGAAAGWLAHYALRSDFVPLEDRGFVASASLQQALEQTPGGTSVSMIEGFAFKPTLTFAGVQQTWCRQYELSYDAALRSGGLACRTSDGAWRVIVLTEPAPSAATKHRGRHDRPPAAIDILDKMRGAAQERRCPRARRGGPPHQRSLADDTLN